MNSKAWLHKHTHASAEKLTNGSAKRRTHCKHRRKIQCYNTVSVQHNASDGGTMIAATHAMYRFKAASRPLLQRQLNATSYQERADELHR